MSEKIIFDYFYNHEADMVCFYRIPKFLVTNDRFSKMKTEAKMLYGLLLDRMSLSRKNEWFDEKQRAFIYFSQNEAMELLNCGETKTRMLFGDLERYGLIERKKQGQGNPDIIYVKNFVEKDRRQTVGNHGSEKKVRNFNKDNHSQTNGKYGSEPTKNDGLETQIPRGNYNNINNTELVITPIKSMESDEDDDYDAYAELIRENLSVDLMKQRYPMDSEDIDGIYDLVLETVLCRNKTIVIASNEYPTKLVRQKFLKLNHMHMEYVLGCMKDNTTKIRNIKKYLLAALFNAPTTMSGYFAAEVSHDMAEYAVKQMEG